MVLLWRIWTYILLYSLLLGVGITVVHMDVHFFFIGDGITVAYMDVHNLV